MIRHLEESYEYMRDNAPYTELFEHYMQKAGDLKYDICATAKKYIDEGESYEAAMTYALCDWDD